MIPFTGITKQHLPVYPSNIYRYNQTTFTGITKQHFVPVRSQNLDFQFICRGLFMSRNLRLRLLLILVDFLTITVETFFTINMIRFSGVGLYMIFSGNYSFAANKMTKHHFIMREWPVDCCLTPYGQYFRNIMTRTSYI